MRSRRVSGGATHADAAARAALPVAAFCSVAAAVGACARLHALAGQWVPAGVLVESARIALAGSDGMDARQLEKLVLWSKRWEALDPRLRELYLRNTSIGAVEAALWHVLEQRDGQASGAVYGTLRDLWTRMYGYPPSIEVLPRIKLEAM